MEGHLKMSWKERSRMRVLDRVQQGQMNLEQAAVGLGLSYRQVRRSYRRYRQQGAAGLVHLSRGRPSNRAKPDELKKAVLARYRERYIGFGPTLAAEKLLADGYALDHETLRRWLLGAELWQKKRKRRKHRTWREPKAHFGEMVQMDGSHHKWFGDNGPKACLIVMVDDATKTKLALMYEEETIEGCMKTLKVWIKLYGIPKTLYTDRKNIYKTNREPSVEEQLAGTRPMTVFGLACHKLGIQIITANSPQAKGRVERTNGIYQDRFVKELELEDIITIDGSNELLLGGFNDSLNRKFSVEPAGKQDFHQPLPKGLNLENVFCFEQTRTVQNDWTVRYKNRSFQILKTNRPLPRPKQKILVREHLDGSITLWNGDNRLKYKHIPGPQCKSPAQQKPWRGSVARFTPQRRSP